ncbi:LOW QUALITY PROTEIN: mini-chromosome maintenance complex-binding protein [Hyla sarda]|uniref:LOW QUALITY PROTEIN: mini-chromosome maintenance complex-binding protein n=1 Tax=Hyla sarda TaxID=327740 RepID=UPI0024C344BD|nr:LOW QUALITY PROTEIN: mini-chromosome maintenance complex-binding protein [Hyla sarda]
MLCSAGPSDWISAPLRLVQEMYAQEGTSPGWEKKVTSFFHEKLQDNQSSWVPSLNDIPLHYLKPGGLVRFRCMIQDMFDPEFYMGVYETVDLGTGSRVRHLGKYRDVADCVPNHEVDFHSRGTVTLERQTFYCIPVPGESSWVKEMYNSCSQARVCASTSYTPNRQKRSLEEDVDQTCHPGTQHADDAQEKYKRLEIERQEIQQRARAPIPSQSLDLYFPLPGEKGPACLVKVYENWDTFKVNDVLEVYGILSVEPALSVLNEDRDPMSSLLDPADCADTLEEQRAHSPPTSLVPRIHAIVIQKLPHNNPLLPSSVCETEESKECVSNFMSELPCMRTELLGFMTHALLGDNLAAEYLILHLISTVYSRRDVLPLGKFSMNLSGCPQNSVFTRPFYRILQQIVSVSHYLPMTIENMNSMRFIPCKDYSTNRLVSGLLQLPSHTLLVVDETVLEQGQLDTAGVRGLTALGNLITWQKVDYDFSYHQMEFPCNINVLVTSEGRSLLPSDCQVPLKPQMCPPSLDQYMEALLSATLPTLLKKFRMYVSLLQFMDYTISEEITKAVEDDFVDMRKGDPQSISADDLHRLLVVARLLSLSTGQTSLSRETWLRAKELEIQRKSRLQEQKYLNGNEL